MREDVFKVDTSHINSLVAPKGKEAIYQQYKKEAEMVCTQEQLKVLESKYAGKL